MSTAAYITAQRAVRKPYSRGKFGSLPPGSWELDASTDLVKLLVLISRIYLVQPLSTI